MEKEILKTIQQYLTSFYNNDFDTLISILDEDETEKYVKHFVEFATKMDEFGETEEFLQKIGVENLETLKKLSTYDFMNKVLALTKKEIGESEINKIINSCKITNIDIDGNVATVQYKFSIKYFDEYQEFESSMKLTKNDDRWQIHFKSGLDKVFSIFQKEIDSYYERKSKDQLHNLNHHVNDLEKITLIGYKNMDGEIVFEPRFKDGGDFSEGYAYVKVMKKYGYIDHTGDLKIKPQYVSARNFSEDLAAVQLQDSNNWGFINKNGKLIIEPKYEDVLEFNEGLCAVQLNDKWGYINNKGKVIIPCQFEEASNFWSDTTEVVKIDKHGELETVYINKKGEVVDEE
jgi:hypothetical protein